MNYRKEDYPHMACLRRRALVKIACNLKPGHPSLAMMGPKAYGRNEAEQGPEPTLQSAVREVAYLDGAFNVLNTWAHVKELTAPCAVARNFYVQQEANERRAVERDAEVAMQLAVAQLGKH